MSQEKTVLVIDDEEDLRDTVGYKFKAEGYTVVTAVDGMDGLEKLKTVKPDLIILDMNMPRMNGLEFYNQVKGMDEKPKFPVLVLTARANMEKLFRDLDVDGFMSKPFELDHLFDEAQSIIKKNACAVQTDAESGKIRARQVCLIEDNPEIFNRVALAFLEAGYIVNSAQSGASAMKRVEMDRPDIMVISLGLKDIAGDIVIGKLQRLEQADDIKYILYSDKIADMDKIVVKQKIAEKEGVGVLVETSQSKELLVAADSLFEEKE